jgi:hypothetical protein
MKRGMLKKRRFGGCVFFSYGGGYFRNGKTTLHRYKYEKKYGTLLPCFVLHHIDGDKLNNRLNNLQPLTQRQHAALHRIARRRILFRNQLSLEF